MDGLLVQDWSPEFSGMGQATSSPIRMLLEAALPIFSVNSFNHRRSMCWTAVWIETHWPHILSFRYLNFFQKYRLFELAGSEYGRSPSSNVPATIPKLPKSSRRKNPSLALKLRAAQIECYARRTAAEPAIESLTPANVTGRLLGIFLYDPGRAGAIDRSNGLNI